MKIVLSSRGSRGDVHPVIEVAAKLKGGGHEVSVCVPELFENYAEQLGLAPETYKSADPKSLMKGIGSGFGALKKAMEFFAESIDEQFDFLLSASEGADALVTTVNEVVAPTIAEYRDIPFYRMTFAPVLPGNQPPPLMPWQNMPVIANRFGWKGLAAISGYIIRKFVNPKRKALGMPPVKKSNDYHTSRSHTLLAINRQLAPPCPTWEGRYKFDYTGYCYGQIFDRIPDKLLEFVEGGSPPVYIGFGSVHLKRADEFSKMIFEAVKKTGMRVIISEGWTGLGNGQISENIYKTGDTNHGTLFSHLSGIIHHGGSGTTHTAARAGLQQFIMPQIIDQYFWGNSIYKNSLGPKPVIPKKITTSQLIEVFDEFQQGKYRNQAIKIAQSMRHEDGVEMIAGIVVGKKTVNVC